MYREQAVEIIERHIDNNIASGSLVEQALSMAIDALKAQLSDLISKTETVEHLRRGLEATVPNTDYDEGYIDGIEFGISTVSTMPTIQPQSTTGQLNDGSRSTAQSTDLIDRQAALDIFDDYNVSVENGELEAYSRDRKRLCELPTIQPETAKRIVGKSRDGMTLWYQCDMCDEPVDEQDNYCRGCGRRLIDG